MKNRYEALLVLNAQGREDTVKDIVDRLESEFQKEGAQIEQVQKMDKRQFSYAAGPLNAGYYVNFVFNAEPQSITKLRSKFKLDPEVYRQNYQRLRGKEGEDLRKRWRKRSDFDISREWPVSIKSFCLEISRAIPEVRYTPKGSAVCDLGIAVNRVYTLRAAKDAKKLPLSMLCCGRAWPKSPANI